MPLASVAWPLAANKTGFCEAIPNTGRYRIGRRSGATVRKARQLPKDITTPKLGISIGGEPIEVEGVDPGLKLWQAFPDIAEHQRQLDSAVVKPDTVKTGQ
jgi:hypothetical protein